MFQSFSEAKVKQDFSGKDTQGEISIEQVVNWVIGEIFVGV
jgi:hypothetical protein